MRKIKVKGIVLEEKFLKQAAKELKIPFKDILKVRHKTKVKRLFLKSLKENKKTPEKPENLLYDKVTKKEMIGVAKDFQIEIDDKATKKVIYEALLGSKLEEVQEDLISIADSKE